MLREHPTRTRSDSGFSLVEVMVATTVFVIGAVGLAPLFLLAARATAGARTTSYAAVLARDKIEELQSPTFNADAALDPSPGGALSQNIEGYCDFLDANGRPLGGGPAPAPNTAFVRRWSIEPLPTDPNTVVMQVLVVPLGQSGARRPPGAARAPGEARVLGVRTRRGL